MQSIVRRQSLRAMLAQLPAIRVRTCCRLSKGGESAGVNCAKKCRNQGRTLEETDGAGVVWQGEFCAIVLHSLSVLGETMKAANITRSHNNHTDHLRHDMFKAFQGKIRKLSHTSEILLTLQERCFEEVNCIHFHLRVPQL